MVIKKIFNGIPDDEVHNDFLKFGKGEYRDKYLIEAKRQAGNWAIKTGPEFVNYLVKSCLKKINSQVAISGIIVSAINLNDSEIGFPIKKKSNFQGVRKLQIETETSPQTILSLIEKYPRLFYALSFKGEDFEIKVKAKAPKSGKPGKESEEGPRVDFCSLKTKDKSIVEDLLFDVPDFKEASVSHKLIIDEIVYPKNMVTLKPEQIREQSKRKGKIIRKVIADGKEQISEKEFVA